MFVIYQKIPPKEIKRLGRKLIKDLPKWFEDNPKRKVCRVELWHGKVINVRKENFKERIEQEVKHTINNP